MIKNFVKVAFRNLKKKKGFTLTNVFGLALGLSIFLLILIYVIDELSYDRYNANVERICRVNTDLKLNGKVTSFAIAAPVVADALKITFPQVEKTVRLFSTDLIIKKGDEQVTETKAAYSDASIFAIFTLPMVEGDPGAALTAPNSIVLTETAAAKYFNSTHVIGKTLNILSDSTLHVVTGVIRDIPGQSHFHFDFLLPMSALEISREKNYYALYNFNTYLLLNHNADPASLESKFPAFMKKNVTGYADFERGGDYMKLNLTPLKDIHLRSNRTNELSPNGDISYVYIFSVIAIFILLIASINFMNLSTARSANRGREVGIRKVLGSTRGSLVTQFLMESLMITFVATIIAVIAAWALLPFFNQLSSRSLSITLSTLTWLLPALIVIIIVVGVLAGSYPAFFLSGFRPIEVLKGKLSAGFKGGRLRSFLVVFQFSISIFLIVSTLVIYHQLNYIQEKDLGFNRNRVLIVKNVSLLKNPRSFKNELRQLPGVVNATVTSYLPTGTARWHNFGITQTLTRGLQTEFWPVDEDYLNTLDIHILKGRNFSNQFLTDSSAIIINETAAKLFNISGDPLNKKITYSINNRGKEYHTIGVIKDFNFNSLRDNISPLVLVMEKDDNANLNIKVGSDNLTGLMDQIESRWKARSPGQKFQYAFMEEDFDAMYRTERNMGRIFILFTSLAILIACLGLFSLAAYASEQRIKEIGIRKVLGAGVSMIVGMLLKDFMKLIGISILIATPIAWVLMNKWLQGFAYRIDVNAWDLVLAGILSVFIGFITIIFQSIKAAVANPATSLRSE